MHAFYYRTKNLLKDYLFLKLYQETKEGIDYSKFVKDSLSEIRCLVVLSLVGLSHLFLFQASHTGLSTRTGWEGLRWEPSKLDEYIRSLTLK